MAHLPVTIHFSSKHPVLAQFWEGAPGHLLYVKIAQLVFLVCPASQAVISYHEAGQRFPGPLGLKPEIERGPGEMPALWGPQASHTSDPSSMGVSLALSVCLKALC